MLTIWSNNKKIWHTDSYICIDVAFLQPLRLQISSICFKQTLPSVSTIRKWYSAIDGKPGFSSEAFIAFKQKAIEANTNGDGILAVIMFDEMAIRKQVEFDEHNNKSSGQINFGTNTVETVYTKEALVFMVTGVNVSFKIPIAYFLIAEVSAKKNAALTKKIILLVSKTGVKVVGLVFDGLVLNFAMLKVMI